MSVLCFNGVLVDTAPQVAALLLVTFFTATTPFSTAPLIDFVYIVVYFFIGCHDWILIEASLFISLIVVPPSIRRMSLIYHLPHKMLNRPKQLIPLL